MYETLAAVRQHSVRTFALDRDAHASPTTHINITKKGGLYRGSQFSMQGVFGASLVFRQSLKLHRNFFSRTECIFTPKRHLPFPRKSVQGGC